MEIEVVSELIEQYGTEVMIFCRRLTGCVPCLLYTSTRPPVRAF